jgi:hypothetical protein
VGSVRGDRGALRDAVYRRDTTALLMLFGTDDMSDRLQVDGSGVLVLPS